MCLKNGGYMEDSISLHFLNNLKTALIFRHIGQMMNRTDKEDR
jgi:hypothetical protein